MKLNKVWHWVVPFLIVGNSWVTVTTYDNTCHAHHYMARFVQVSDTGLIDLDYNEPGAEPSTDNVDILDLKKYNEVHADLGPFTHSFKWVDGKVQNRTEGSCGKKASRNEPKLK